MSCSVSTATSGAVKPWSSGRTISAASALRAERFLPAVGQLQRCQAMIVEQPGEPLARADRVARQDDFLLVLPQLGDVLDDGLIDIGVLRALGREVARALDREVDDLVACAARGRARRGGSAARRSPPRHSFFGKIERRRGKRAIAARLGDHRPARGWRNNPRSPRARLSSAPSVPGIAHDDVVLAEMVEQGRQLLLEQRQPMLHPGQPPPFADRLVERVAGGVGAELSRDSARGSA